MNMKRGSQGSTRFTNNKNESKAESWTVGNVCSHFEDRHTHTLTHSHTHTPGKSLRVWFKLLNFFGDCEKAEGSSGQFAM